MRKWILASWTVAACAPTGESGAVLLTLEARGGGATLEVDGERIEPILPREYSDSDVRLVGFGEDEILERPHGTVALVGERGELDWLEPGVDFLPDELLLDAPEAAARELAESLGAEVEPGPDGLWRVTADDIVRASALVDEPDGLVEARLVEISSDAASAVVLPLPSEWSADRAPVLSEPLLDPVEADEVEPAERGPDQVGIFEGSGGLRIVDAGGGLRQFACQAGYVDAEDP